MTWVDEIDGPLRLRAAAPIPPPLADALRAALDAAPAKSGGEGRAAVRMVAIPGGEAVVRRCLRGGLVRHVLPDRYLFVNRPLAEFTLHASLFAEGLPVPEPLGVAWIRRGPAYLGALATRRIEAPSLATRLETHGALADAEAVAVADAIRRFHEAGVLHGDLNAMNILLAPEVAYLIDLDKSKRSGTLSAAQRRANLARLGRSLRKKNLPHSAFAAILKAYGP